MADMVPSGSSAEPRGGPANDPASDESPLPLSTAVRDRLRRQKVRDTAPELALRRRLHALGLRYRVNHPVLGERRRRPDVVFTRARVAVFVDGCFWHRCPQHAVPPKNNADWWATKLQRTVNRDAETDLQLRAAGWLPIRVWEHEPADDAAARIREAVTARRGRPQPAGR